MVTRWQCTAFVLCLLQFASFAQADIFRWDTGEVIPGTEGVHLGPGVSLRGMNLAYADLSSADLRNADLTLANLNHANLSSALLTNANLGAANAENTNLEGASLENANLGSAQLKNANLSGTVVRGAQLWFTTTHGFTKEQLYSTASYQDRDLRGIRLSDNDLTGWNFSGQDLSSSFFSSQPEIPAAVLAGADLSNANLSNSVLAGADLSSANLSEAHLNNATMVGALLTNTDLTNANLSRANLSHVMGLDKEQFYASGSYRRGDLQHIDLSWADLYSWDFSDQDLSFAQLWGSDLRNASFHNATLFGASLRNSQMRSNDLKGADLRGSILDDTDDPEQVTLDESTRYDQWTVFSPEFSPEGTEATLAPSLLGDFDGSGSLDIADLDLLQGEILASRNLEKKVLFGFGILGATILSHEQLPNAAPLDLCCDEYVIDLQELSVWVHDLKITWFGDANLDGEFDSSDLVMVFSTGAYERAVESSSEGPFPIRWPRQDVGWAEGDWNADGRFTSSDLVLAFQDGGYEQGPRPAMNAVPEPTGLGVMVTALPLATVSSSRRRDRCF